jgi:hypothetical protein
MERERRSRGDDGVTESASEAPGKRTRTDRLVVQRRSTVERGSRSEAPPATTPSDAVGDDPFGLHLLDQPVQRRERGDAAAAGDVHTAAARGIASPAGQLPHLDRIQASFGPGHDLSRVQAHVGGAATEAAGAMGASAYATGDHVAFAAQPDLHTAAHEAAHVVQQAQGVSLYGGVGEVGDQHERNADAVADRVVAGESAADLLGDGKARGSGSPSTVQRLADGAADPLPEDPDAASDVPADADPGAETAAEAVLLGDAGLDEDAPLDQANPAGTPGAALAAANASTGQPLPTALQGRLERAAGAPLQHVRVHEDPAAGAAAESVAAKAFTHGEDIYFAPGAYDPASAEGQELIAHEVLHTLQPEAATPEGVTQGGDAVEHEADRFAQRFAADERADEPAQAHAPRTALPRFPGVVTEAFNEDKIRFIDPANESAGKVWQEDRGYIKNTTAKPLSSVIKNGKVGGGFENGTFMYVVDEKGEVWVGKRQGKNMPHPTLIGGKSPQVQAAGMVKIEGGKIVQIDNHSGHFRPPRGSLKAALKSYLKLPKAAFKNFKAESVHFDGNGAESRKRFNSLRMLKLKTFSPGKAINRIKMRYKHDPKFKGGLKSAGKAGLAIIALLIAEYFIGKWMAEMEAEQIREAIARLAPKVEEELLKSLEAQADTLDEIYEKNPDAEVYLNVVYRLAHIEAYYAMGGEVATSEGFAGLELKFAEVSTTPVKEGMTYGGSDACFGSTTKYHDYSMSEAVKLSDLYETSELDEAEAQ